MKRVLKLFICICLAVLMMGVLFACETTVDLDEYKANAKTELENYAIDKDRENYFDDNWSKVLECVAEGKAAIDDTKSKGGVDRSLSDAKKKIDEISADILEVETGDMLEFNTWFNASGPRPNAITVKSDIANATFECIVYEGILLSDTNNENETLVDDLLNHDLKFKMRSLSNNETIYWRPLSYDKDGQFGELVEHDYVDIIVYDDDNIIGYAVIEVVLEKGLDYDPVVLKSAIFPKVEGSYQHITEDILKIKIEKIKTLG